MVHGGMTMIKYLLFLFNFIFWLSGIGIIVGGAVIQIRYSNYINFLGTSFLSAPILLIVVGCIVSIIGFFGCCGSIRENYCMTMTFAVLLGIVFILELAAGISSYVMRYELKDVLINHARDGMQLYNDTGAVGVTQAWNKLQQELQCCGLDSYRDWNQTKPFMDNNDVPESCCVRESNKCGIGARALLPPQLGIRIYDRGCLEKLMEFAMRNIAIVGGIGCGLAFIQLIGMTLACLLSSRLRKGGAFYNTHYQYNY